MERVRLFFLCLLVLFGAQDTFSRHHPVASATRSNDFTIFEENGRVGLKDQEGQILIPASYDAIGWSDGKLSIIDKVVGYRSNGLWGLIHTSNKIVTEAEFLHLKPGEGSFLVAQKKSDLTQRSLFGIINTSGKTVIPFAYDALRLSNMRAVVMVRSGTKFQFGLVDLSHKVLIPLQYQQIQSLGSLRYAVENFENQLAIFSDDGRQLTAFDIDSISSFKKDYAVVYRHQRQGLIDRSGQMVLNPTYGEVQLRDDGSILFRDSHTCFLLHGDNKLVAEYKADKLKSLSPNNYLLYTGNKLQLTDNNLNALHAGYLSSLDNFQNGLARYRIASKTGVINDEGRILISPRYHDVEIEQDAFRACLDSGGKDRWILLDANGNRISEKNYEYIGPYTGKYYPVKKRGYWGAVNILGDEIVTCVHDSILQESNNNLVVKFKGEYGVINLSENWLVTPQNNPLKLLNDQIYLEFSGAITFVKSFNGEIIYFSENPLEYRDGYLREQLASGAYLIIDESGIIIERSHQPPLAEKVYPESEGLRAILKDGKFGFIDDAGRLRIANRYEEARRFSDGLAAIRIMGKWGFIDRHEKLVIQPVYDSVDDFYNDRAIVQQDGLSGLMDASGKLILPVRYEEIILNSNNRFKLRQNNAYGLADASGSIMIQPRYDELIDAGNGYVIVQRDGKFGLLTLRGVSTVPMVYDELVFDPHHNQFIALKKSKWETFRSSAETRQ